MQHIEMEKLVSLITKAVLAQFGNGALKSEEKSSIGSAVVSNASTSAGNDQSEYVDKRLFVEKDILELAKKGVTTIHIPARSIITPAARDILRQYKITIDHDMTQGGNGLVMPAKGTNKVALFTPICPDKACEAFRTRITAAGFEAIDHNVPSLTQENVEATSQQIAQKIAAGEYCFGIVIYESVFSLCVQANKVNNVRGVVCWNSESVEMSQKECCPNMLFINNKMFGFAMVDSIVKAWLGCHIN